MILNTKYNLLYIHIPKSAGTYITRFMIEHIDGSKKLNFDGDTHYGIKKTCENVINWDIGRYLKFLTVRNPWDWYVSLYEYVKKDKNRHEWKLFCGKNDVSFKEWLEKIVYSKTLKSTVNEFKNDKTSTASLYKALPKSCLNVGWLTHRLIYSSVIDWENMFKYGHIDDFDKICSIDRFVKIEEMDSCLFEIFGNKIGQNKAKIIYEFGKKNVNRKDQSYNKYYDDESAEWVRVRENLIIKKFNYEFI